MTGLILPRVGTAAPTGQTAASRSTAVPARLASIDAVRGFVMIVMLLDHVRETFFVHMQVSDPMDARTVAPALFFTRLLSAICAPTFIALTGLSAWLYQQTHSRADTSLFLLKRGLVLLLLEVTVVSFGWSAQFPPHTLWLQVIWAIGICMIALAGLIRLPLAAVAGIGAAIVLGHNLLDTVSPSPDSPWFKPWAMLHQRAAFGVLGVTIKTTYPVLPWIGVIALGYVAGPLFARPMEERRRLFAAIGIGLLLGFVLLRAGNVYGDRTWAAVPGDPLRSLMSFVSLTKYPPSLLFLLPTLGGAALLLAAFEGRNGPIATRLAVMGGAAMGFYLLHIYVLRGLYLAALALWGPNHGEVFGLPDLASVWLLYAALIVPLYVPTRWFAGLKRRRRDWRWLRYI